MNFHFKLDWRRAIGLQGGFDWGSLGRRETVNWERFEEWRVARVSWE